MKVPPVQPPRNPFIAKRIAPGTLPYVFPEGDTAEGLICRLREARWRGQIIGPHGTGKSTLLATLLPLLEHEGRRPTLITLRKESKAPRGRLSKFISQATGDSRWMLVIDGYEQLGRFERWRIHRQMAGQAGGLLVTTHRPLKMEWTFETRTNHAVAQEVVRRLTSGYADLIATAEVNRIFEQCTGDVRELLFKLYDLYEQRVRQD